MVSHAPRQGVTAKLLVSLLEQAASFVAHDKLGQMARQWGPPAAGNPAALEYALDAALGMILDLAVFQPSASGQTAIDRMARQRKNVTPAETSAIAALRQARFRLLRVEARESPEIFRLRDLASGETLLVLDHGLTDEPGQAFTGRAAPLGQGVFALVGASVKLDDTALALALGFSRPDGKGLTNPQRCAEAVYRHVTRHPPLAAAPENTLPPPDPEDGVLTHMAYAWMRLGPEMSPSAADVQRVRDLTHSEAMVSLAGEAVEARQLGQARLAEAFTRMLIIQIETARLRETNGMTGLSLAQVSEAIAKEVAARLMPAAAQVLFDTLTRRHRPAEGQTQGGGQGTSRGATTDLDRLVQRIQALREKTVEQGCTEHEALAAAEKVAELLDRYGLSLNSIEQRAQVCAGIGIDTGRRRASPVDDCVPAIAAFFDCRTWAEKRGGTPIRHIFFGPRADVAAAQYLYDLIEAAFAAETAAFARGDLYAGLDTGGRRRATNSFQIGLARGIHDKLKRLRQEREAGLRAGSGRDLVAIKAAVVEQELARLGLHFKTRARATTRTVLTDAYEAGEAAGQRFEYRPGLGRE